MEEDLKHIDLIDKYLSGNLKGSEAIAFQNLLKTDSDFKKEVEIYERIYKKIEARGEVNFKKRLGVYYKEYLQEKSRKPKGIYRKLIIISSIAATIIFGVVLFNNNNNLDSKEPIFNQQGPIVVDIEIKDSLTIEKTIDGDLREQKEVIVQGDNVINDSIIVPGRVEYNTQLSIGGLQKLPAANVRAINFPIAHQYTFDGNEIVLFGNSSISGLQLQILKDASNNYFLKYIDQYYSISKSNSKKILKVSSNKIGDAMPTEEQVHIKLMGIDQISITSKNIEVSFIGNKVANPTYFFQEKASGIHIVIDGDLNINHTKVYKVREEKESSYFLKVDKKLYQLNSKVKERTPLKETYILTNKLTQLFREDRKLPAKTVYLIK